MEIKSNKAKNELKCLKRMFSIVLNIEKKGVIWTAIICAVTAGIYPVILELNYLILNVVENSDLNEKFGTIILMVLLLMVSTAIFQVTKFGNLLLFEKTQINIGTLLLNNIYHKISFIPHKYFEHADNVAKLERIVLFSQDSMLTQNVVHLITAICNIFSLIFVLPILYQAGIETFFMILIGSLIINMLNFDEGYMRWEFQQKQEKFRIRKDNLNAYFNDKDAILEMRMLQSNGYIQDKWEALDSQIYQKEYQFEKKMEMRKLKTNILSYTLKIIPLVYISWKAKYYGVNIAAIFLVWQTQSQFGSVMESIFNELKAVHYSVPYIDELCDFLTDTSFEDENRASDKKDEGTVLKHVDFSYDDIHNVLEDINLKITSGEKVAIIGANGAGKTTLVKLIAGLYNATNGQIDREFSTHELGVVWQDYVKFELTLRESVGLGYTDHMQKDEKIVSLLKDLDLEIPGEDALEHMMGRAFDPDGLIPSEGQWQKIAIARAVFGDRIFLCMDEPTAALDPISEVQLYSEIKKRYADQTVVFVSHRVGFASLADRIIVVGDGKIEEDGTHEELIQKKGYYYQFYQEQLRWYER